MHFGHKKGYSSLVLELHEYKKTLVGVETALKIELVTHQKSVEFFTVSLYAVKNWKIVLNHSDLHLH